MARDFLPPLEPTLIFRSVARPITSPRRPVAGRVRLQSGGGPVVIIPPTAGVATVGRIGPHSIGVKATAPSSGTAPYTYQWQYRWPRGSATWVNAVGTNVTSLSATVGKLGPASRYDFRLKITDAASTVVFSNVLTQHTQPRRWYPGLGGFA